MAPSYFLYVVAFWPARIDRIAPWMDLRPTAASNQPLQSAPPPQHTHFIPTPPPSEQAGTDVSAYLSVTLDTASGGASAPAGTLSKRGVELTSLPNVDESRPITCILDDSVIDCFAQVCAGRTAPSIQCSLSEAYLLHTSFHRT